MTRRHSGQPIITKREFPPGLLPTQTDHRPALPDEHRQTLGLPPNGDRTRFAHQKLALAILLMNCNNLKNAV